MSSLTLQFRPLSEFIGPFKVPQQPDAFDRIVTNLSYYGANYFAIYALLLVFLCVQHPSLLFALIAIAAAGIWLFNINNAPIRAGGSVVTMEQQRLGYAAVSAILFLYVGGWPAVYVTAVAALVSLIHAALRQRSLKARSSVAAANVSSSIKREINAAKRDLNR